MTRLAWAGTAVLGIAVLIAAGVQALGMDMCSTTVFEEVPSPSGRLRAVLLSRDCGATTGFSRHVQVLLPGQSPREDSPFVIDGDHGAATLDVQLRWDGDGRLIVRHDALARVFHADASAHDVAMTYQANLLIGVPR